MFKKITQLAIITFLLCSLSMPVEARSSSSSSSSRSSSRSSSPSSSSSFKSAPSSSSSNTSYSRSSSSASQTKPTRSSSSSNSSSTFSSSYNSSYSSRPVEKPITATTTTKPSVPTTYAPSYSLPVTNTTGRTETRYVTIFSDSGNRTVPVVVPFGYTQPIVLPNTYYPATTVVNDNSAVGGVIGVFFLCFFSLIIFIIVRSVFF